MGLIWEISLAEFGFVTLILGGGAAWLAGRALAGSWEPAWKAAVWMVPLAAAVRFIHYALFSGSLLTLHYFVVDLVILVAFALAGHRMTLARRMARQYGWLYERAGPFGWRRRDRGGAA
ncbi:DUF6867 family protein [Hansschlegelia sp.]|uniref:DUF6867 family protein n=1 Tax=Hansschlegelia sp. TaxID=2041892 RepID=UPI002C9A97CC|nr:hypothetical protein [Hansschlegelia sp.]HVI28342.1 hypothetical protein [Hansschlegelia sp.]